MLNVVVQFIYRTDLHGTTALEPASGMKAEGKSVEVARANLIKNLSRYLADPAALPALEACTVRTEAVKLQVLV